MRHRPGFRQLGHGRLHGTSPWEPVWRDPRHTRTTPCARHRAHGWHAGILPASGRRVVPCAPAQRPRCPYLHGTSHVSCASARRGRRDSYREHDFPIRFWRTKSGLKCDFVLGRDGDVAIEVKGASRVRQADFKGLRAFVEEHRPRTAIVVCNEDAVRRTEDGIWILPWERFLERLWGDEVVG